MKDKKELLYKRALITCVIMLFVSIILKVFGSTLFNLKTDIPFLQNIDKCIMNNTLLSFMYSLILMLINSILVFMITTKRRINKINFCLLISFSIGSILYKSFYGVNIMSFILEIMCLLLICVLETNEISTVKECIITLSLNLLYQILSLFIRDLGFQTSPHEMIINLLLNLDYYSMLVITYLYLKKGDMKLCLIFHQYFSSLHTRLLKKPIAKLKECLNKV